MSLEEYSRKRKEQKLIRSLLSSDNDLSSVESATPSVSSADTVEDLIDGAVESAIERLKRRRYLFSSNQRELLS